MQARSCHAGVAGGRAPQWHEQRARDIAMDSTSRAHGCPSRSAPKTRDRRAQDEKISGRREQRTTVSKERGSSTSRTTSSGKSLTALRIPRRPGTRLNASLRASSSSSTSFFGFAFGAAFFAFFAGVSFATLESSSTASVFLLARYHT